MILWLALMACAPDEEPAIPTCNGAADLCDKPLNHVAFLRSHNSHASDERGYSIASRNHWFAIPTQLADGVRALNVDVYLEEEELVLCHGFCGLGSQPFDEAMDEIDQFMNAHPTEVVLLDFQDETPEGVLVSALDAHPLSGHGHVQPGGTPWPTLQALIDADTRLVMMGHPVAGDPSWFNSDADLKYGTDWQYDTPEELDCAPTGEVLEHGLYEVTHVLTNPIASVDNAEQINHQPLIGDHIGACVDEVGFVNMLSIDYYSIGDGQAVVDGLNGG